MDLLNEFDSITVKPMFGGHGLYQNGVIFAIIVKGALYFKADDISRSKYTEKGLTRFAYQRKGMKCTLSYYLAPEETLEDKDELYD